VGPKGKAGEGAKEKLEKGESLFAQGLRQGSERGELPHDLPLPPRSPFLHVFTVHEDDLTADAFKREQPPLVPPAEAIFLNAKLEADLAELDEDEALELLQSVGQ
ncbi:GTP-binding protein, partial [Streptomyces sp. WM6391]